MSRLCCRRSGTAVAGRSGSQISYLKAASPGEDDRIGRGDPLVGIRMALSGDGSVLAAGAPGQNGGGRGADAKPDDFTSAESGAVYVFVWNAGCWTQQSYVKAPNAEEYDQVGSGVALSADGATMAVAANGEDGGAGIGGDQNDDSVRDSGAVYVY